MGARVPLRAGYARIAERAGRTAGNCGAPGRWRQAWGGQDTGQMDMGQMDTGQMDTGQMDMGPWEPHPWVDAAKGTLRWGVGVSTRAPAAEWGARLALARAAAALGFETPSGCPITPCSRAIAGRVWRRLPCRRSGSAWVPW